ncbi:MAG: hypothetical protein SGJ15_05660 [Bacteroidota bacterium]|nr:hypothetical protein [Bacteroidota bacterium]
MRLFLLAFLMTLSFSSFSQDWSKVKLDPIKEKKFLPYVETRHGGPEVFAKWKEDNKFQYVKEMWYMSESFSVKRNHSTEGITLNEEIIDVVRFESQRKENEEVIITLPGFKDAIVLMPTNKLFYLYK